MLTLKYIQPQSSFRIIFKGLIITLLMTCQSDLFGQFSLKGQYISRAEMRHGYKSLVASSQDPAFFVSQRTRLMFGYNHEKYRFGLSIQDVRTWGSQSQLNVTDNLLSVHEAWGEIIFKENLSIKIGRQELIYDDHRILGSVDWTMQGRSHDLALLKYTGTGLKAHVGAAYNQDQEQLNTNVYTVPRNYKTMQFLWMNKKLSENISASLLFLNNGLQASTVDLFGNIVYKTRFSQTTGGRVVYILMLTFYSRVFSIVIPVI